MNITNVSVSEPSEDFYVIWCECNGFRVNVILNHEEDRVGVTLARNQNSFHVRSRSFWASNEEVLERLAPAIRELASLPTGTNLLVP